MRSVRVLRTKTKKYIIEFYYSEKREELLFFIPSFPSTPPARERIDIIFCHLFLTSFLYIIQYVIFKIFNLRKKKKQEHFFLRDITGNITWEIYLRRTYDIILYTLSNRYYPPLQTWKRDENDDDDDNRKLIILLVRR